MTDKLVKISTLARMAGVPTATIKHYMREGLLPEPELRTSRNMAYYDPALADRIRTIKALQKQRFLPLKVIRSILEPSPSAAIRTDLDEVQRRRLGSLAPLVRARFDTRAEPLQERPARMTRQEILDKLDITPQDLDALHQMELIEQEPEGQEPAYAGTSLDLLYIIDETRRLGLGPAFPLRILETYAAGLRTFVRLELELFRQRILDHPPAGAGQLSEISDHVLRISSRLVNTLRSHLILSEVDRLQAGQQDTPPDAPAGEND